MGGEPNRTGDPKTKPRAESLASFGVHWGLFPGSYLALLAQKKTSKNTTPQGRDTHHGPKKGGPRQVSFFVF